MKIKRRIFLALCGLSIGAVAGIAAENAAAPRLDAWRVVGPGGGGAMFYPAISPHDPKIALVRCDMTGSYVTLDGGTTWRMFNLRTPVNFFAYDPADARTFYAGNIGLWRSTDQAVTWKLVWPLPEEVAAIHRVGDHGDDEFALRDGTHPEVLAMAVDPSDPKHLYLSMRSESGSALIESTDGGARWSKLRDLESPARHLWIDPSSPKTDRTLYVSAKSGMLVRVRGAWNAQNVAKNVLLSDFSAGFSAKNAQSRIYAISEDSIHVSVDSGAHWTASHLSHPAHFMAVATSLNHPEVAYVSFTHLQDGPKPSFGVAKTVDGGNTWEFVWKETVDHADARIHDAWITPRFGPEWGENPLSLTVDPNNPDHCYATDLGRTLITRDGGQSWHAAYSKKMGDAYTSTGLDVTTTYGVHFDPFNAKRMFITYTDIGVFRSEDGGATWVSSSQGIPDRWVNTTYWMAFDPEVQGRVWAVASGTHDLPRPKMWRRTGVARYQGGVVQSEDGGKTWSVRSTNLPQGAPTHIVVDPRSSREHRTLYVTMFGRGVYKSTDGGTTWTLKNNGLEGTEPFAWRLTRDAEGTLYLVVARRSEGDSFGDAGDGALYKSTDGAEHWTRLALPKDVNGPNGLTVDPKDPKRLYLAAWGRGLKPTAQFGGVYVSTDGGASWERTLDRDQLVYDVTQNPSYPDVLYACGFSSALWRSTDRGRTWSRVKGFNFKWGHRVILDPRDPKQIYVTTFGGSVWHGPAVGDPRAGEDVVTPQVGYDACGSVSCSGR